MATLEQFLGEIGAGSLSTVIELPSSKGAANDDTQGPAAKLYQRIKQEVEQNDDKTLALLKDQWDDFAQQLKTGDELVRQLKDEEDQLVSLENEMDGPDAFLPPLVSHLEKQQSLAAAHLLTTTSVTLLSTLLAFNTTVAALSDAITSGDLVAAVQAQRSVTRAVEVGADEWIEQTDVWKSLIRWAAEEESRLEAALQGAVETCFQIEPSSADNGRVATLVLCERVAAAPNGAEIPVDVLLQGLEDLAVITGRKDQSDVILVRVAKQLLRHFIAPFLEANGPPRTERASKPRLDFVVSPNDAGKGRHTISLQVADGDGADAIEGLSVFLDFVTKRSSLFPISPADSTSKHVAVFTAHLTPSLQSHVISAHLTPSLPTSIESLDGYMEILAAANTFESDFLATHHLFAFLPPSLRREGREVEEQRVIRSWATRVPHHWARHVGDSALARVRSSVKSWDWGAGEMVEVEVKEEEEMLGLLLGLGLVDPEDEAAVTAAAAGDSSQLDQRNDPTSPTGPSFDGKRRLPRELALQTVPKSAKREMTIEEALRPKIRRARTPSPPRRPEEAATVPAAAEEQAQPVVLQDDVSADASRGVSRRGKLGAARIVPSDSTPLRSPSPPPLFQGNDAPAEVASLPDKAAQLPPHNVDQPEEVAPSASAEPVAPPSPTSDQVKPVEAQQLDQALVVVPQPFEDEVFAPFEAPAPTAAGIETTADSALEEDVVRPHEYRAEVHEDVGNETEDQREETPLTEANLDAQPDAGDRGLPESKRCLQATSSVAAADESPQPDVVEHAHVSPPVSPAVKEESIEPELPQTISAVDFPLAAGRDDFDVEEPQSLAPSTLPDEEADVASYTPSADEEAHFSGAQPDWQQTWQPVPIETTDFEEYDGDLLETADFGVMPSEAEALPETPQAPPESSASLLFADSAPSTADLGAFAPTESLHDVDASTSGPEELATMPEPQAEAADTAYVPFDDDPYADDSFAYLADEDYPAPTRDDFFSPPDNDERDVPVEAAAPAATVPEDPYAPLSPPGLSPAEQASELPSPATLQRTTEVAPSNSSRYEPPPQRSAGVPPPPPPASSSVSSNVLPPPPPPRASNTYAPAPRSKPPKRRIIGLDEPAPASLPRPETTTFAQQPSSRALQQQAAYEAVPSTVPSAPVPPPVAEPPRPVIAPLRSAFTNLSRPTRSGTPPRQDGPILNHIQQRFVSPPPSMLNPYVPMSMPHASAPASSYLPANDPLLADLLGGVANKAKPSSANYFSPDRRSTVGNVASPANVGNTAYPSAATPYQAPYGAYPNTPNEYGYGAPNQSGQQYGFAQYGAQPSHMQPAMRMRGGFSPETVPEDAAQAANALRLRGGADLGEMDDDGNHSADDWGFGDESAEPGDVEDAWGFDEDEGAPDNAASATAVTTSPASLPIKPASSAVREPRAETSPIRAHSSTLSNASHTSAVSQTPSTPSIIRSRPTSFVYSPSLAPPPRTSLDLVVAESTSANYEGEETGDDAWGFGEEGGADDGDATEAGRPVTEAAPLPTSDEPGSTHSAEAISMQPGSPHPQPAAASQSVDSDAVVDLPAADTEGDDWGFGSSDDADIDQAEAPSLSTDDVLGFPHASPVSNEAIPSSGKTMATTPPPAPHSGSLSNDPPAEVAPDDESYHGALSSTDRLDQPPSSPKTDVSPDAIFGNHPPAPEDEAEDAWGLDQDLEEETLEPELEETPEHPVEETQPSTHQSEAASHEEPLFDLASADNQREREGSDASAEEVLDSATEEGVVARRDDDLAAGTEGSQSTPANEDDADLDDHREVNADTLAGVAPPKPVEESSDRVAEPSALNIPAEQLQDKFPEDVEPAPVDTPLLAQPLPHSDNFVPGAIETAQDSQLVAYAAAQLDDAGMLLQDDEPQVEDPWSFGDDDEDAAETTDAAPEATLTALDEFAGDQAEATRLEDDLPISETFLEPEAADVEVSSNPALPRAVSPPEVTSPAFDDFADFAATEDVQQAQQPAWEPFEEPSGQPESTPASATGYDRRADHGRDGFSAEPSEGPEVLRRSSIEDVEFDDMPVSRAPHGDTEVSPPTSGEGSGVMVGEAEMSSPELVERNVEWEGQRVYEGEGAEVHADDDEGPEGLKGTINGAEILEDDQAVPSQAVHVQDVDQYADSVVQHEELRPAPHDDSAVQHVGERMIVADDVIQPGVILPAQDVHPQQRTFTPPATALPEGDDSAEWDFGEENEEDVGAEVLAEPDLAMELAPPPIPEESTVQHLADRVTTESAETEQQVLPAASVQPQEHTFSPPATAVPVPSAQDVESATRHTSESSQTSQATSSSPKSVVHDSALPEISALPETQDGPADRVDGGHVRDRSSGAESLAPAEQREGADVDDPWDLDPLEPEATVSDFIGAYHRIRQISWNVADILRVAASAPELPTATHASPTSPPHSISLLSSQGEAVDSNVIAQPAPSSSSKAGDLSGTSEPTTGHPAETSREAETAQDEGEETWDWNDDEVEPPSTASREVSTTAPAEVPPTAAEASSSSPTLLPAPEQGPPEPTVRREKMMVSQQSREIIAIAEQVLLEAFEVSSSSFRLPQFSPASEPLLRTFVSILSLYRATASVHNSNLLASVPAIAMQFANDAEWIGREAERVWHSVGSDKAATVAKSQVREIELAIESTRQLGRDTRQKQISIQQAALMESLDEAGGFLGTSNENRYAACERALQQVIHTLQRLALVWKPIMTSTALYTTLGGLVNEVLLRVLDEIEEQTDISEEESIRLNKLSKMLHDLEGLFDGSETNVGREVPIWYKFSFLSELLEASMADFMFLFDNRFLLDFTPQELVRLLRALFADSPQRDAAVKRVLQGHPDAPADEEESS
ncbi:hypothetical protein JCM10908_004578 [Rhodotorula pacifica]|uniref:uncharacterized protein n=1 Tax=Rhodotorula pacifica TaxID=1495444 RepID=UPI00316EA65A